MLIHAHWLDDSWLDRVSGGADEDTMGGDDMSGYGGDDTSSYGGDTSSYGGDTSSYGGDTSSDGGDTSSDGGDTSSYGGDTSSYGGDTSSYGGDTSSYGGDTSSDGGDTSSYGGDDTSRAGGDEMRVGGDDTTRDVMRHDVSDGGGESWSPDDVRDVADRAGDQDAIDRRFSERDAEIGAAQREIQRDLPFASQTQSRILAESQVRDRGDFADLEGKRATQYWENTPQGDPADDPSALYRMRGGFRESQPGFSRPSYPFGAPGPRLR